MMRRFPFFRAAGLAATLAFSGLPALAQDKPAPDAVADDPATLEAKRDETRAEAEQIAREIELSKEKRAALQAEVEAVKKDRQTITAALVQAAKTEKKLTGDIARIEERIDGLKQQQATIHASLKARRAVLAEVLAALQRMGLNPPPALLVKPEDALGAVRSAILLGAVVPSLRSETESLLASLTELQRVSASIGEERERLKQSVADQAAERSRLEMLQQGKEALQAQNAAAIEAEGRRAEELAAKATSMQELVASLEANIESVRKAKEEEMRRAAEEARLRMEGKPPSEEHALPASAPLDALKGKLSMPVSGRIVRRFGEKDGFGGHMTGDTVQTQSGAIVTAPVNGIVLFAGRFRSYRQLLILDPGNGYHIVLAGMDRLNVSQGQSVVAGEPVGIMGETRQTTLAGGAGATNYPELLVEFRKDAKPVDPAAWWPADASGRTRNDT